VSSNLLVEFSFALAGFYFKDKIMARVKYLTVAKGKRLGIDNFPNFSATGSIVRMKEKYYGKDALLVRCGSYIYNVTNQPNIYWAGK